MEEKTLSVKYLEKKEKFHCYLFTYVLHHSAFVNMATLVFLFTITVVVSGASEESSEGERRCNWLSVPICAHLSWAVRDIRGHKEGYVTYQDRVFVCGHDEMSFKSNLSTISIHPSVFYQNQSCALRRAQLYLASIFQPPLPPRKDDIVWHDIVSEKPVSSLHLCLLQNSQCTGPLWLYFPLVGPQEDKPMLFF